MISREKARRLLGVMNGVAEKEGARSVQAEMTRATLKSLNPLTFTITEQLEIRENMIVIPKYKVFIPEDIGKKYVFFKNAGGQTYYFMYEASQPQGSNGVPYYYEGKNKSYINSCKLIGTCSCGHSVEVTHGDIFDESIEYVKHEKRVEK